MNINSLKLFIHLCESKSFSKTAHAMHVTPSTLSRQIQKLEQKVGQPLFVRDNRSVDLTNAGRKLLPVALQITNQWYGYYSGLSEQEHELQGEIHLFCSVTASYSHLPDLLNDFRLAYPQIELKLSTGDPAQAVEIVLQDKADIAIAAKPEPLPARLSFETIGTIPLSVIAPTGANGFAQELSKEQPDWRQIPFILPEAGTARDRANQWFKKMKIRPTIYAQVSGHEAIVSMVALGCGIGIAPDVVINNSPVKDKIQRLKVAPVDNFDLGICCNRSRLNDPLIQALWRLAEGKFISV
jgi:LysR family positive regulator for ilvC